MYKRHVCKYLLLRLLVKKVFKRITTDSNIQWVISLAIVYLLLFFSIDAKHIKEKAVALTWNKLWCGQRGLLIVRVKIKLFFQFDGGDIFTAIGGSLGLFLGFSFLDALLLLFAWVTKNVFTG